MSLNKQQKGQGLIEMLVAISIILTAVVGGLSLMIASFNAERESLNRTIAANLGREAIEICKNNRDSAWMNGDAFRDWFTHPDLDYTAVPVFNTLTNSWSLDFLPDDISDGGALVYKYTSGDYSGMYNHEDSFITEATLYRRLITLTPICWDGFSESTVGEGASCDPHETIGVKINAQVQWQDRGQTHEINLEHHLYNWRYR